jgi:hypothetical protein
MYNKIRGFLRAYKEGSFRQQKYFFQSFTKF